MQTRETVTATFCQCAPEDYEIKKAFKIEWNTTECATIIGYFSVFRDQILKENKAANG
jgi:hypothetical protein